jgi:hypothetical protein
MTFDQQPAPGATPSAANPAPEAWTAPAPPQPAVTVPVAPVVRPKPRSSRWLDLALLAAGLLAVGGVAFGVGRATAPAVSAADGSTAFNGPGNFRKGGVDPNGGPGRGGPFALGGGLSIDGTVTAVTDSSVTLKLASGQEITFTRDTSTTYHDATAASSSEVAVGSNVSIKVKGGGGGRVFTGPGASPAPGASSAPNGGDGAPRLEASDITVTH